jgi:hypothetical protein
LHEALSMTHYMELLATNQPWNLIIFMAIPVICAEFIAVTELYILFKRDIAGFWKRANSVVGVFVGFYFTAIFVYLLLNAAIPLTATGGWRGPADVIAVGFYLSGIIPLLGIALLEIVAWAKGKFDNSHMKLHATFVAVFLVVAHVAMIFGMLDPRFLMVTTTAMAR